MLAEIGVSSVDELFAELPPEVLLERPLDLPDGVSEAELAEDLVALAGANRPAGQLVSFLGAGVYDHYVPAVVDAITSRSEFLTAYTPYQAERSQGVLQAIFEFQTAISELTGLPVANASLYDGGTAMAEAAFLAAGSTRRGLVVVSEGVHPEYRRVLASEGAGCAPEGCGGFVAEVPAPDGLTSLERLEATVNEETAAVILQQPSFFGGIEDMAAAARIAHEAGALFVAVVDPITLGVLQAPADYGADVAVGEGQALGNPMSFGGPHLGFMAVRRDLVRAIPGRLVGQTVDAEGRRGFVLTFQTREQHIRREKATSNICSNQALNALAALVYLSWLGRQGLPELGLLCARKTDYLRERLLVVPGVQPYTAGPVLREFAVRLPVPAREVVAALSPHGYLAGLDAGRFYPGLDDVLIVAVTEKRTRAQLDAFADALAGELAQRGADRPMGVPT